MSAEDNKRIVLEAYRAVTAGDVAAYFALLDDEIEHTFFGDHRFARTFRGKDDIAANMLAPVAKRLKGGIALRFRSVIAEGDQVVVEAEGEARTRDGLAYNNRYCIVLRLRNGKIVEMREYLDTALTKAVFGPLAAP